jgi:hypothetical protein
MINEYGSMFFESGEASSSSAAPPPPPSTYEVPQPFGSPVAPALALDTTEDPKAPPDWDDHFSTEIFGWSSYPAPYDGMNDDRHVLFPKITIFEFSSLLSPMHCLVSLSSHRREPTPWRWSGVGIRGRDSDRRLHLLSRPFLLFDDKGGEVGLKLALHLVVASFI